MAILDELRAELDKWMSLLKEVSHTPHVLFEHVNRIAAEVGERHCAQIGLHFPRREDMADLRALGTRNVSIVFDNRRREYPWGEEAFLEKVSQIFPEARVRPFISYRYTRGYHLYVREGRIDVLPGALFIWAEVSERVKRLVGLYEEAYPCPSTQPGREP